MLPENHLLRPVDLGACGAAGLTEVQVRKKPSVAVIPTGTEIVPMGPVTLELSRANYDDDTWLNR